MSQGQYEFRIPTVFDDNCPSVLFEAYDIPEHIALSDCFTRLPDFDAMQFKTDNDLLAIEWDMWIKPEAQERMVRLIPQSKLAKQCSANKYGPIRTLFKQLVNTESPLLTVLVYRFPNSNETVVRIILPHCVFDASNIGALFRAWSDSVNGRLESVPSVLSFSQAPESIRKLDKKDLPRQGPPPPPAGYRYADTFKIITILLMLIWRWLILPILRFKRPKMMKSSIIYVPDEILQGWRKDAQANASANGKSPDTFLSDNDLTISWFLERAARKCTNVLDGQLSLGLAFNIRTQAPELAEKLGIDLQGPSRSKALANAKSIYPHNGIIALDGGTFSWQDIKAWPKWALAYKIRDEVTDMRKKEHSLKASQVMAGIQHNHITPKMPMLLPMDPKSLYCLSTSWRQADPTSAIDFSSAVLPTSDPKTPPTKWAASTKPGKVSDLSITDEQSCNKPPLFMTIFSFVVRPGKGIFVGVACDGNMIEEGVFGRYIDLRKV